MNSLIHWFTVDGNAISVLVTMGIAVLLVCCLECSNCWSVRSAPAATRTTSSATTRSN